MMNKKIHLEIPLGVDKDDLVQHDVDVGVPFEACSSLSDKALNVTICFTRPANLWHRNMDEVHRTRR